MALRLEWQHVGFGLKYHYAKVLVRMHDSSVAVALALSGYEK